MAPGTNHSKADLFFITFLNAFERYDCQRVVVPMSVDTISLVLGAIDLIRQDEDEESHQIAVVVPSIKEMKIIRASSRLYEDDWSFLAFDHPEFDKADDYVNDHETSIVTTSSAWQQIEKSKNFRTSATFFINVPATVHEFTSRAYELTNRPCHDKSYWVYESLQSQAS